MHSSNCHFKILSINCIVNKQGNSPTSCLKYTSIFFPCSSDGFFGDSSIGAINMFKWAMKEFNMENLKHPGTPTANFVTQSVAGDDPFEAGNRGQFIYLFKK